MLNSFLRSGERPRIKGIIPVILVLDTSGSMKGDPIQAVNVAIETLFTDLIERVKGNAEVLIAAMAFDNDANWVTGDPELINPKVQKWDYLDPAGATSAGAAFAKLKVILDMIKDKKFAIEGLYYYCVPVIMFFTDGASTDDYEENLRQLKQMPIFKNSVKIAIGFGNFDRKLLEDFTGNKDDVFGVSNVKDLEEYIVEKTLSSTMLASSKESRG